MATRGQIRHPFEVPDSSSNTKRLEVISALQQSRSNCCSSPYTHTPTHPPPQSNCSLAGIWAVGFLQHHAWCWTRPQADGVLASIAWRIYSSNQPFFPPSSSTANTFSGQLKPGCSSSGLSFAPTPGSPKGRVTLRQTGFCQAKEGGPAAVEQHPQERGSDSV